MAEYCNGFVMLDPNEDKFIMQQGSDDFRSWSGLRGPYYTPHVDIETGTLWFSNDAGLPNPDPVRIVGQDGRGIQLAGYASSVEDLPEEASHGDCWAVGEEDPLEAYAWFDGWCDLGELFPRGQDGTDGVSPEVTITAITGGTQIKITDKDHPAGQTFDVMNGQNGRDGTDGEDGVSPEVTMTEITGGTRLTITDADHPSGQSSDIMNGAAGPGVPSGGSAGQFYRKASATDYDGEWHTLSAGDSSYDSSLTYSSGTVGLELNSQRNTLNQLDQNMAYVESGNTATRNYSGGEFISWKGTLYTANGTISSGQSFSTGAGGNLTLVAGNSALGGGLNSLKNSSTWKLLGTATKPDGSDKLAIPSEAKELFVLCSTNGQSTQDYMPLYILITSRTSMMYYCSYGQNTTAIVKISDGYIWESAAKDVGAALTTCLCTVYYR